MPIPPRWPYRGYPKPPPNKSSRIRIHQVHQRSVGKFTLWRGVHAMTPENLFTGVRGGLTQQQSI